jgi:hypothetical protein
MDFTGVVDDQVDDFKAHEDMVLQPGDAAVPDLEVTDLNKRIEM